MKKIILSLLMFLIVGVSQVAAHGGRLDSMVDTTTGKQANIILIGKDPI